MGTHTVGGEGALSVSEDADEGGEDEHGLQRVSVSSRPAVEDHKDLVIFLMML